MDSYSLGEMIYREIKTMTRGEITRFRAVLRANLPAFITQAASLARGDKPVTGVYIVRPNGHTTEKVRDDKNKTG